MPKYTQDVQYNIKTTFDKTGIAQLQAQLKTLESSLQLNVMKGLYSKKQVAADLKNIQTVSAALNKAYSTQTGLLNLGKFTSYLKQNNVSVNQFAQSCSAMGVAGQQAFNNLVGQTMSLQSGLKQTTTLTQKLGTTLSNTVRWSLVSGAFQEVMASVQSAVNYVKRLDESLTQITMVSGESRDNMKEFASYANKAAASLAASTTTYTNAVKVFIQEGFNLEQSKQQATQAVTLANVSEQDSATTADQITAYRNAFNLSISDMNTSLDKIANLANNTASNVGELMTASQRSASTAASVGASQDSFLSAIATIESVTRDSAENIGNGLKSIYTRFADIQMGKSTDDDVNLNKYSKALKSAGVNILDSNGQYKGFDQVLTELQSQWKNLSQTQQLAVGQTVAGRYQYNRFAALMNNEEYYQKAYAATQNADGAMEKMQEAYEEGLEGQLQKLSTNIEALFTSIYDTGIVEDVVGAFSDLSGVLSDIFDNIDSKLPVVSGLLALLMKFGGTQMAQGITNMMTNRKNKMSNQADIVYQNAMAGQFAPLALATSSVKNFIQSSSSINANRNLFSEEELAAATEAQENFIKMENERIQLIDQRIQKEKQYRDILSTDAVWNSGFLTKQDQLVISRANDSERTKKEAPDTGTDMAAIISRIAGTNNGLTLLQNGQKSLTPEVANLQRAIDKMEVARNKATGIGGTTTYKNGFSGFKAQVTRAIKAGTWHNGLPEDAQQLFVDFNNKTRNNETGKYAVSNEQYNLLFDQLLQDLRKKQTEYQRTNKFSSKDFSEAGNRASKISTRESQVGEMGASFSKYIEEAEEVGEAREKIQSFAESIGNVSMAITGLSMGASTLEETWSVFSDGAANSKEKMDALANGALGLATELSMLIPILSKTKTALNFAAADGAAAKLGALLTKANLLKVAVAALAVAAGYAFTKVQDNLQQKEIDYNNYSETLSDLQNAQSGLSEKYNELDASLSKVYEGQQSLNDMTRGTDEWRESMQSLNAEVLQLVQEYPKLARYVKNENGILTLDKTGADSFLKEQYSEQLNFLNTKTLMQTNKGNKKNDSEIEEYLNENLAGHGAGQMVGLIGAGALSGAAVGAVGGSIPGAVVGALVGAIGTGVNIAVRSSSENSIYGDEIRGLVDELRQNKNNTSVAEWNTKIESLAEEMGVTRESLLSLIESLSANTSELANNTIALQGRNGAYNTTEEETRQLGEQINQDALDSIDWHNPSSESLVQISPLKEYATSLIENSGGSSVSRIALEDGVLKAWGPGTTNPVTLGAPSDIKDLVNYYTGSQKLTEIGDNIVEQSKNLINDKDKVLSEDKIREAINTTYGKNAFSNDFIESVQNNAIQELKSQGYKVSKDNTSNDIGSLPKPDGSNYVAASENLENMAKALGTTTDVLQNFQKQVEENINASPGEKSREDWQNKIDAADRAAYEKNVDSEGAQNQINAILDNFKNYGGMDDDAVNILDSAMNKYAEGKEWGDLSNDEMNVVNFADNMTNLEWNGEKATTALIKLKQAQQEANDQMTKSQKASSKAQKGLEEYNNRLERITKTAIASREGFKDLANVMKDSYNILNDKRNGKQVNSVDYGVAINEAKTALQSALQIDDKTMSKMGGEDFILKNLDIIKSAAGGSTSALRKLEKAGANAIAQSSSFMKAFGSQAIQAQNKVSNFVNYLLGQNLDVGGSISMDTSKAQKAWGDLRITSQKQAQAIAAILASLGFEMEMVYTVDGKEYKSKDAAKQAARAASTYKNAGYDDDGNITNAAQVIDKIPKIGFKLAKVTKDRDSYASINDIGSSGSKGSKTKNKLELDPYQQINAQLQRQQKILDKLNASYDRLYGKNRIKNIQAQLTAERKYMTLLQKEANIAEKQLKQNTKLKRDPDTGNKTIKNYIGSGKGKRKNLLYDDGSINQKAYEAIAKELFKKSGKNTAYENFKTAVESYNSDYEKVQEMLNTIDDAYNNYFETLLKQQEYIQELRERNNTLNKSYYDLKTTIESVTNDLVSSVVSAHNTIKTATNDLKLAQIKQTNADSNLAELDNQNALLDSVKIKHGKKKYTLRQLMSKYNDAKGTKTEGELAKLIEKAAAKNGLNYSSIDELNSAWVDAMQADEEAVADTLNAYKDRASAIIDAINSVWDAWDERASKYGDLASRYNTISDINQLVNGEEDYANQIEYGQKALVAIQNSQKFYQEEYKRQKQQRESYEEQLKNATTEDEKNILENQIAQTIDQMSATQGKILSSAKESQEHLKTIRDRRIDNALKNLLSTGFGAISWISTKLKWEMNKENADDFYDNYQSNYQKSALKYQYNQLKSNTKNLTLQNKIAKAMKSQMDYLDKQNKLSKFEIEYAQKKLSILQAQIALENAQNNKTQLNLRRDSTGNYSYVYTANQEEVEKAQDDLAKARNDAYETARNQLITSRDNIESYLDKMAERYKDSTDEERNTAIQQAANTYLNSQWKQISSAWNYLYSDFNVKDYSELGFTPNDEILSNLTTGSVDWNSLLNAFSQEVNSATGDYNTALSGIGDTVSSIETDVKDLTNYFTGTDSKFISDMDKHLKEDNEELITSLTDLTKAVKDAQKKLNTFNEQKERQQQDTWAASVTGASEGTAASVAATINDQVNEYGFGMKSSKNAGTWGVLDKGDVAIATKALDLYTSKSLEKKTSKLSIKKNDKVSINELGDKYAKVSVNDSKKSYYAKRSALEKYLASYDTGGYTGSWSKGDGLDDKNGKLALLHQKEIVLNSDDTSNLLTAVKLVREMKDSIQSITDLSAYSKKTLSEDAEKVIEQRVEITATFPAANNADDIRSALLSIADKAYQYSN